MTVEERHAHWRSIISNQATSGMNIAAYCREGHIRTSLFYTWRRRLRDQEASSAGFLELHSARMSEDSSGICILLDGRIRIEVARRFDSTTLRAVVETLSRCSA